MVIMALNFGEEVKALKYNEYDFEVGDETNDFAIKILLSEWEDIPDRAYLYIPGTEYGGIYRRTEIDTKQGYISVGGLTWRGMLQSKIIEPEPGADYAIDDGDINTIINNRVSAAFDGLMVGGLPLGKEITYRYNRYVTLYDGLKAMLQKYGYRLRIVYDISIKRVVVDAVPIIDYSDKIEFSDDMRANYYVNSDGTGVNHLICLGNGQLKDRIVIHLYADAEGNISQEQTFFGKDEIAAVYDYAGADAEQLLQSGTEQFKTLQNINEFSVDVEAQDIEVGDIVGGKDYVSGLTIKAPVTGKIHKSSGSVTATEYTISNNVEVHKQ